MEWVETVAKSVEAAKSAALDRLGVAEDEAEFEVVSTPKPGLFGRVRGEARVRARVRPASVRPKTDRRRRSSKNRGDDAASAGSGDRRQGSRSKSNRPGSSKSRGGDSAERDADPSSAPDSREDAASPSRRRRGGRNKNDQQSNQNELVHDDGTPSDSNGRSSGRSSQSRRKESTMSAHESATNDDGQAASPVTPDEVATAAVSFLEGLAGAFGSSATGTATVDGTDIDVQLSGDDLGLLIGPAGGTLQAVQDLTRVVAQRKLGDHETRLRVDVAQYRERRRVALEKFARAVSDQVIESQRPRALEPMSSADRKVIHDTVQTIDGVESTSDGSDPNRRVVITPAEATV